MHDSLWPEFVTRLDDEDPRLARITARVCGFSERPEAAEAIAARLVPRLEAEPEAPRVPVAGAFVMAAADCPCEAAVPGLELALRRRPADWEGRIPEVLASMGSVHALLALARFCFDGDGHRWKTHRREREAGLDALGVEALLGRAEDPCPATRLLALEARARRLPPGTRAAARSALHDEERLVRIRAATLLARLGDQEAIEALRSTMERATRSDERRAMLLALHQLGDPTVADRARAEQEASERRAQARKSRAAAEETRQRQALAALLSRPRSRSGTDDDLWLHWLEVFLD